ncbi:DNA-binding protein [Zoogloea oleivorans]|jgi:gp16 family phage-associated protein|uniref:DNA-binding protein n=1 Tax=Zoogloea oleivorans TaxID=1552750 RepID=UPI001CA34F59
MVLNANQVREWFRDNGITIVRWAHDHGFSPGLVYQVTQGKRKCLRGQSHLIAVALGLKKT